MTQNQTKDSCESKNNPLSKHVFILNKKYRPWNWDHSYWITRKMSNYVFNADGMFTFLLKHNQLRVIYSRRNSIWGGLGTRRIRGSVPRLILMAQMSFRGMARGIRFSSDKCQAQREPWAGEGTSPSGFCLHRAGSQQWFEDVSSVFCRRACPHLSAFLSHSFHTCQPGRACSQPLEMAHQPLSKVSVQLWSLL